MSKVVDRDAPRHNDKDVQSAVYLAAAQGLMSHHAADCVMHALGIETLQETVARIKSETAVVREGERP